MNFSYVALTCRGWKPSASKAPDFWSTASAFAEDVERSSSDKASIFPPHCRPPGHTYKTPSWHFPARCKLQHQRGFQHEQSFQRPAARTPHLFIILPIQASGGSTRLMFPQPTHRFRGNSVFRIVPACSIHPKTNIHQEKPVK